MSVNLPRWIFASTAVHLKAVADSLGIEFHAEGVDEDQSVDFKSDNALFRMNGPFAQPALGIDIYTVETQILLTDIVSRGDNPYDIFQWAGEFQNSMLGPIQILRKGNGVDDDDTLVDCMYPDRTSANPIRVVNYGEVDITVRVRQVSVNGRHTIELCH